MEEFEFTILMPCLDEERTLGGCIEEAGRYIAQRHLSAEILVADNGSSDSSAQIAKKKGARVVEIEKKGYGNALIGGIKAAKGTYVIMADCDGSYDFSHLDDFVEKLRMGYSLVVGNRFLGGIEKGAMPLSHRFFGVPLLSFIGRCRYGTFLGDFHCGLRGVLRQKALDIDFGCEGMEFATEMIAGFVQAGCLVAEVPVHLRKDGRQGRSHLRSIPDGLRHLRFLLFGR